MNRRHFFKYGAAFAASSVAKQIAHAVEAKVPILDTHIHLFDPSRPGGVPWPLPQDQVLYKPALPPRYSRIAEPLGIVGAIEIEASPLENDNDWVLDIAARHPIIVATIGDLIPGSANYQQRLMRYGQNQLFRGIRYGNLWNRNFSASLTSKQFVSDIKLLADRGMIFESANPDLQLLENLLSLKQMVSGLSIVIDHVPNSKLPDDKAGMKSYLNILDKLAALDDVYIKLSEVPKVLNGKPVLGVANYKERLDALWDRFGEDRVLFGSDWPNSDTIATLQETVSLMRGYMATRTDAQQAKFFYRNSIKIYKWKPRTEKQKQLMLM